MRASTPFVADGRIFASAALDSSRRLGFLL
jgi:hypothetical protein